MATVGLYISGGGEPRCIPVGEKDTLQYRAGCLAQAFLEFFVNSLDGTIGLASMGLAIITLKRTPIRSDYISRYSMILSKPFYFLIAAINPHAEFIQEKEYTDPEDELGFRLSPDILSTTFLEPAYPYIGSLARSQEPLTRHVISRIAALTLICIASISFVADLAIAFLRTSFALLQRGQNSILNAHAYQSLKTPGELISAAIFLSLAFLSPSTLK